MKTFKWLLQREIWEHKGGLVWAPVLIGALMVALMLVALVMFGVGDHAMLVQVNGEPVADAAAALTIEHGESLKGALAVGFFTTLMLLFAIPTFISFFYCLGALFDERKDRSVFFWKSLPISDSLTVASKAVIALVLAPLITLGVACCVGVVAFVLVLIAAGVAGVPMLRDALMTGDMLLAPLQVLGLLPIYALWALPTVGWLLLVSSWARSKPFLWAVGVPVATGVLLVWFNSLARLQWDLQWFWTHVVGRGLLSGVPGSWLSHSGMPHDVSANHANNFTELFVRSWQVTSTPSLWIGVVLGLAFLIAATRIRRWRED